VPVELLRDLVILTARLAGRRWPEANPDSVAVFTALYLTRMLPPLASSARSLLAFCRAVRRAASGRSGLSKLIFVGGT